jgi:hypothetical protein
MRESRTYGFVRGAHSDMRPYRDPNYPQYGANVDRQCRVSGQLFGGLYRQPRAV